MATSHVALTEDRTILSWLTPARRKAIYGLVAALITLLTAAGVVTGEQGEGVLSIADQVLGIAVALLAMTHTGGTYVAPVSDLCDVQEV